MQETMLILSCCQSICRNPRRDVFYYKFHFKGFYFGSKIKEIHVYVKDDQTFTKEIAYLLWVRFIGLEGRVLKVNLIKHKEI